MFFKPPLLFHFLIQCSDRNRLYSFDNRLIPYLLIDRFSQSFYPADAVAYSLLFDTIDHPSRILILTDNLTERSALKHDRKLIPPLAPPLKHHLYIISLFYYGYSFFSFFLFIQNKVFPFFDQPILFSLDFPYFYSLFILIPPLSLFPLALRFQDEPFAVVCCTVLVIQRILPFSLSDPVLHRFFPLPLTHLFEYIRIERVIRFFSRIYVFFKARIVLYSSFQRFLLSIRSHSAVKCFKRFLIYLTADIRVEAFCENRFYRLLIKVSSIITVF